MYVCSVCEQVLPSISGLCSHLLIIHAFNVYSTFNCRQNGCEKIYGDVKAFRKHLKAKHPLPLQQFDREDVEPDNDVHNLGQSDNDDDLEPENAVCDNGPVNNDQPEHPITVEALKLAVSNSSLALATKLYSVSTLNRKQVQEVINCLNDYSASGFLEILKSKVFLMLQGTGQTDKDLRDLNAMFDTLQNMFCGLESETLRVNALKDKGCYIIPESYVIGVGERVQNIGGHAVVTPYELTGQFIPMKKVLKAFFERPGVLEATLRNVTFLKNSRKFTNIVQSPLWQNVEANYFQGKTVLPIFLYFDDVEPDNQSGSHSGDHSLGVVYYEVPCIPQYLLSSLDNIFVAAVFLTDDRRGRNREAFQPILNELMDLATNGVIIETETGEQRIFFCLCLLLGDNLGLHSVLGLVSSFSANYFCRFCKEHKRIMQRQSRENTALLRNRVNYAADLLTNDFSLTGIVFECILHILRYFHVCENLVVDIMHDLLEGVCHYDLCAILNEYIYFYGYFTLETLNERVQNFDYGPESGDKPPPITREHIQREKLKMSASEMLCFVRNLGLIIGDLVPEGDECWKIYKLLVQILDIVTLPYVIPNVSAYLSNLISEHHELYCRLLGKTLKPKHHFMLHYPRVMNLVGPLITVWAMRLEAKNRPVVKQVARAMNCRKNLPLSIVRKYLLSFSSDLLAHRGFPCKHSFKGKDLSVVNCDDYFSFQNLLEHNHQHLKVVKEVEICGTSYKSHRVLVVNYEEDLPLFGLLRWIIKHEDHDSIRFVVSLYRTVGYCEHLHCYHVTPTEEYYVVAYKNLVSFYPSFPRTGANGNTYVTFRHLL